MEIKTFERKDGETIWWVVDPHKKGKLAFSFDKKHIYYLFGDYPDKLTKDEKEVFDRENPFWADFFKGRR